MSKKDASLDALLKETEAAVLISPEEEGIETSDSNLRRTTETKRGRGRPKKIIGNRQQLPVYMPDAVYFELLDWVSLQKRSDRQFSMNDVFMESMELWLAAKGRPSIQELIDKLK